MKMFVPGVENSPKILLDPYEPREEIMKLKNLQSIMYNTLYSASSASKMLELNLQWQGETSGRLRISTIAHPTVCGCNERMW